MKKLSFAISLLLAVMLITGCGAKKEVEHLGLNAEVISTDTDNSLLFVKDVDESAAVFGENSAIDCSKAIERDSIIYVKYDSTGDITSIAMDDLIPGDHIMVNMYDSEKVKAFNAAESEAVLATQIQLGTQRF